VTVQYWVYFFLGMSVLSLVVAFFFARQVIGSDIGTPAMQKIAGAIKEGAEAFLKRRYKTVAALLGMGLLLPTFAYAQEHAGGGEASLVLPDLSSVSFANFFGMNGHALLISDCCSASAACCSAWRSMCS
jgi:K(+)-stimulated pyrophosphate-energized sodium pump